MPTSQSYATLSRTRWRPVMRSKAFLFLLVTACFGLGINSISAHHGLTNYDMKRIIELSGTVTGFDWANPHCLAHLDVMDDGGHTGHWTLEMSSTFAMSRRGWDKDTLKRGDHVTLEAHPAKNGSPMGINSG